MLYIISLICVDYFLHEKKIIWVLHSHYLVYRCLPFHPIFHDLSISDDDSLYPIPLFRKISLPIHVKSIGCCRFMLLGFKWKRFITGRKKAHYLQIYQSSTWIWSIFAACIHLHLPNTLEDVNVHHFSCCEKLRYHIMLPKDDLAIAKKVFLGFAYIFIVWKTSNIKFYAPTGLVEWH